MEYNFEIDDIVEIDGEIYIVTGCIHNEQRLYVVELCGKNSNEQCFSFKNVTQQWRKVGIV